MRIIQVVGYKNSGKTTLTTKLISHFSENGLKVASLKHHGHGGPLQLSKGTDSEKHRKSGAILSGVEGSGIFQLTMSIDSMDIEQILAYYQLINLDLLVIEGYKTLSFDKVVLLRNEADLDLLDQLSNVQVVISSFPLIKLHESYQVIDASNDEDIIDWAQRFLERPLDY